MYRPSSTAKQEGYRQHNEFRQMLEPFKYQNCPAANCAWSWRSARAETGNPWTAHEQRLQRGRGVSFTWECAQPDSPSKQSAAEGPKPAGSIQNKPEEGGNAPPRVLLVPNTHRGTPAVRSLLELPAPLHHSLNKERLRKHNIL